MKWIDHTPDFLDEVAVELALAGREVGRPLHHAERLAVARELLTRGEGATAISKVARCSHAEARTLVREVTAPDRGRPQPR